MESASLSVIWPEKDPLPDPAQPPSTQTGARSARSSPKRKSRVGVACLSVVAVWLSSGIAVDPAHGVPARMRFEQISIEQGLPQQTVLSVIQDRRGFMWLATQAGVVRFDGYRMKIFRHDHTDPSTLASNRVWSLFEDSGGTLWAATAEGGLNRFDAETETFRAFRHDPEDPSSIADDRLWALYEDEDRKLWAATSSGLSLFDPRTETFTNSMIGDGIRAATQARLPGLTGSLWLGTSRRGLVLYDPEVGVVENYRHTASNPDSLPNDQVLTLYRDRAGALWVGTAGGLALFDEKARSFRVFRDDPARPDSLSNPEVQAIFEDRSGNLWAGSDQGLSLLDRESGSFTHFRHDPSRASSLPHRSVASIFEDRTGILWLGTWYGGAAKVDPRTWQFEEYLKGIDPHRSPPGGVVSLYEDPDELLWVGTSDGLRHFDSASRRFSSPGGGDPSGDVAGITPGASAGNPGGDVEAQAWVAFSKGRLELWDSDGGASQEIDLGQSSSRRNYINALYRDASGVLWIGSRGLIKLEPGPKLTRYTHRADDPASIAPSGIKTLAPGGNGSLWIGYSDRGLARLAAGSERFEHFRLYAETEGQPSVSAIFEDETGRVWVGTNSGLFSLTTASGRPEARAFTSRHGLGSDLIASLLPADDGLLWLGTAAGLTRFDPETETFHNFGSAAGALPGGYNHGAALRTRDGRMVFGGSAGMTIFRPEGIRRDDTPPMLALTDLRLRNESVEPGEESLLDRPIHLAEEVVLSPEDDSVSFEFAALHFANAGANRYAYQLEGFDPDWIYSDAARRVATYTDLPPGSYTLRVRGSNLDGVWSEQDLRLPVRVLPPWWRTWWAYALYFCAFGGLISSLMLANRRLESLVAARTVEIRRQARQLQEESDAKAQFIANVSHEFRTPLTLTIGPLEELSRQGVDRLTAAGRQNLETALANSRRMMGLVGQVLDVGRLEKGRLKLRLISLDLAELVRRELGLLSAEAKRCGIDLVAELPEEVPPLVADTDAMSQVVSNLLFNAVKFSHHGGSVRVRLEVREEALVLQVIDTGVGIAESDLPRIFERYFQGSQEATTRPGTGIGLSLVKELVELHGGGVEARSRLGEGSVFTVTLPLGSEHFQAEDIDHRIGEAGEAVSDSFAVPAEPEADEEDSVSPTWEDSRPTVLVVDDNPELRHFLSLRLATNYRVLQAEDGEEALKITRQELPDLVVSDVAMPTMDGFEMTRRLREDSEISFIPVLLLTAKATKQETIRGFESGADDYLTKPFDTAELAARIAALLTARRRMSEHLRNKVEPPPSGRQSFEEKIRATITENLHDHTFTVQELATSVALDRTALFRKSRQSFGRPPSEVIRQLRLERAAELLRARKGNITEVCYAVGFTSVSYFGKRFRERYGVAPSRFGREAVSPSQRGLGTPPFPEQGESSREVF